MLGEALREALPFAPCYAHLISTATAAIFAGSHASLTRPSSAAKPSKSSKKGKAAESGRRMEGLTPADAIYYPVLTGCLLAGLYLLLKWLDDPAILNKILNWYLSTFGAFATARLLSDSTGVLASYVFPDRYRDSGAVWQLDAGERQARSSLGVRDSPLPGSWSRSPLSKEQLVRTWRVRDVFRRPFFAFDLHLRGVCNMTVEVHLADVISMVVAVLLGLWFNLVSRPWFLTNLLSFGFGYQALQLISPTTFWTGTLVLVSLFFYDIYFVFFTPMMITVATKLDIPVKFLFPRPARGLEDPAKQYLAMLGLGDIVLPGIMMALALRFDLYMHYLKKQKRVPSAGTDSPERSAESSPPTKKRKTDQSPERPEGGLEKAAYVPATGSWGERLWLGSCEALRQEGGYFPKTYFLAANVGYVLGLVCTLVVMHVFKHGQPALLYLVPGVLIAVWGTALAKGEVAQMWAYTEDVEEDKSKQKGSKAGESNESETAQQSSSPEKEGKDSKAVDSEDKSKENKTSDSSESFELLASTDNDEPPRERVEDGQNRSKHSLIDFTLRLAPWSDGSSFKAKLQESEKRD